MLRSRFLWKLYAGYALLVILAVTAVGILVSRRMASDTLRQTEAGLRAQAILIRAVAAPALQGDTAIGLHERIRELGAAVGTRFTVLRADGVVVADSDDDPLTMDNHANRPEVLLARENGSGMATRFSRTVAANLMYYALRVGGSDSLHGYVRAAVASTAIEAQLAALRQRVALGALLSALAALVIGFVIANRVTAPIISMTSAAEAIAAGDYGQRVSTGSQDEVAQLASAFNRMAGELEHRLNTIVEDRSKLLTILGGMVEGVVAVDRDERVLHLNAAAAGILGALASESIGKPIWEVTRIRGVVDAIAEALRSSKEVTSELHLEEPGRESVVELHAAPLLDGEEGLTGAVLVLHEVTDLRRLETVRRDFVANVSHELKTPITAIRGLIETITDHADMPADTRDRFLDKIRDQANRLSLLVTDLLALARLESTEGIPTAELLDLRDPVLASAENFRLRAEEAGIQFSLDMPDQAVHVVGDAETLELMVNNLLDNAVNHTPRGGQASVCLRTSDDEAEIEVRDTGIGITREHHERIFERFYRVDKARSRELGGTGLGLSIVKHIAKVHGGNVSVESALGSGSTFRVQIPVAALIAARPV